MTQAIGGLYADLAKETYKLLEGYVAAITPAKQLVGDTELKSPGLRPGFFAMLMSAISVRELMANLYKCHESRDQDIGQFACT
jgi:hypothetical protein